MDCLWCGRPRLCLVVCTAEGGCATVCYCSWWPGRWRSVTPGARTAAPAGFGIPNRRPQRHDAGTSARLSSWPNALGKPCFGSWSMTAGTYWLNGQRLGRESEHRGGCAGFSGGSDPSSRPNVLAVKAFNALGPAGVIARLAFGDDRPRSQDICSDRSWKASQDAPAGWTGLDFSDAGWPAAASWRCLHQALEPIRLLRHFGGGDGEEITAQQAAHARLLASPETFARQLPARAAITQENGSAVVTINGQRRPAILYRGTIDPMSELGRRQIKNFAAAGIHLFVCDASLERTWRGPASTTSRRSTKRLRLLIRRSGRVFACHDRAFARRSGGWPRIPRSTCITPRRTSFARATTR